MTSADVIVIGGGLSGLSAVASLIAANPSLKVVLLEAQNRHGGRTLTLPWQQDNSVHFDMGGTWTGPGQVRVQALAKSLGIELVPQYHKGKKVLDLGCRVASYSTDIPTPAGLLPLIDLQIMIMRIERMAKQVPLENPHEAKHARKWDNINAMEWVNRHAWTQSSKDLFEACIRGVWGCDSGEVSLLYLLHYTNSSNGIERIVNIHNGHQESTFRGGTQQLSEKWAKKLLENKNVTIVQGDAVTSITQDGDDVNELKSCRVRTANGVTYSGSYAIVAMAPTIAGRSITYTPRLRTTREQLLAKSFMGCIIKVLVVYDRPYWREAGYSGEVVCDCASGPSFNLFDQCKTDSKGNTVAALICFINGTPGREWGMRTAADRREALLKQIDSWFGDKKKAGSDSWAYRPIDYIEKNWVEDQWARGCPTSCLPTATLFQYGHELRRASGRIHWAGTETAIAYQGFMDGAIESGERAAKEVVARLNGTAPADVGRTILRSTQPPVVHTRSWLPIVFIILVAFLAWFLRAAK